jgi:hypothetical protein
MLRRSLSTIRVLYRGESRQVYFADASAKVLRGPLRLAVGVAPHIVTVEGHYGIAPANHALDCTLEACMLLKKWPTATTEYDSAKSVAKAQLAVMWLDQDCRRIKKAIGEIIDDL